MSDKKQTRRYLQCPVPGTRAEATPKYMPLPRPSREYTQTKMSFSGIDRTHPFSMSSEARNVVFESGVPVSVPGGEEILKRYEYVESVHGFDKFLLVFHLKLVTVDEETGATSYKRYVDYIIPKDDVKQDENIQIPTKSVDSAEYDSSFDVSPKEDAKGPSPDEDITFTSFATCGIDDETGYFPDKLPQINRGEYYDDAPYVDNHEYYVTPSMVERDYEVYTVRLPETKSSASDGSLEAGASSEKVRTAVLFNTASSTSVVTSVTFSQSILVFPDKYRIWFDETKDETTLSAEYLGDEYPDLCSATAFNGRLYGVDKKGIIYVSKYNKYDGWELDTSSDISSSNAWISHTQTNPLSGTEFMSIVPYASRVLALKSGMMYTIYGSANPFRVRETVEKGTIDSRSVCVVSDVLYFLAHDGVYAFDSSSLTCVSDVLGISEYKSGIAAAVNGRYYLYTCGELFVYDTSSRAWSTLDTDGEIYGLASIGDEMYAVYSDGKIVRLVGSENKYFHEFSLSTSGLIGNTLADRRIKEINLICDVANESSIKLSVVLCGANGESIEKKIGNVYSKTGLVKRRYRINLPAAMCEKIKISGYGRVRIIALDVSHTFTV